MNDDASLPADAGGADRASREGRLRHALRTPLNHIIGYSELVLETAVERGHTDMTEDLRRIQRAGRELLALVDGLSLDGAATAVTEAADGPSQRSAGIDGAASDGVVHGRLLVVDDNADNREVVARLLQRVGYEITSAANGAEALERIAAEPHDLVLLDVMMPVMDGIEACTRLKANPDTRLVPVVIMTALGDVEDRVRGIRAGADDFLVKPVNRDELLARIETSLRLKRTVDERFEHLRTAQAFLSRFVPHWVTREIEANPDAPTVRKSERDISAMFVDVSAYTRLSENMGQAADFVIEKYFSRFLDCIHAHGGDITETSGDGMMVIFPDEDPAAHALHSVHAAREIIAKTEALNTQLAGIFDPIAVHIGINSGIALIGPSKYEGAAGARWTYTALGPVVNLAARIAGVAEGGMICIGTQTARRVGARFTLRDLGPHTLKNVAEPVAIFEVTGEAQAS